MSAAEQSPSAGYGSLRRGLEVLSLVQDRGRVSVAELAESVQMPLSTVYRYVSALRESGFLLDDHGLLVPSTRLSEPTDQTAHLVDLCAPVLGRLRDRTQMSALVVVRVHTMALCLEVAPAPRRHRIFFSRGQARPLYAGGSALPLLAFAPYQVVEEVFSRPLRSWTTATPDLADLEAVLQQVRAEGVSITHGQVTPGLFAIGVPVLIGGRCLCCLSLVGEESELPRGGAEELVPALREAVEELTAIIPPAAAREAWSNVES